MHTLARGELNGEIKRGQADDLHAPALKVKLYAAVEFVIDGDVTEGALLSVANNQTYQAEFTGHGDAISKVAFSPRDDTIATVSKDQTLMVWDRVHHTRQSDLAAIGSAWKIGAGQFADAPKLPLVFVEGMGRDVKPEGLFFEIEQLFLRPFADGLACHQHRWFTAFAK